MTAIDRDPGTARRKRLSATQGSWRRSLVRTLLYGRNVDRAAKTKARLGLAILVFALVYAVIGGRLIMFATVPDGHTARRTTAQDAIATARPDIVDRNGEILATDVQAPSLFAEPRRIIDNDEAIELLSGVLPDLDTGEVRERLGSKRLSSGSSAKSRPSSRRRSIASAFPASASCARTSASIPPATRSRI